MKHVKCAIGDFSNVPKLFEMVHPIKHVEMLKVFGNLPRHDDIEVGEVERIGI
jgi:hypothetical protein